MKEYKSEYFQNNKESIKIKQRKYDNENRETLRIIKKIWEKNNQSKVKTSRKKWNDKNADKKKELNKKWWSANKELSGYYSRKRQAAKLSRTPPWSDIQAIKEFYKNCPKGFHVDHIYPLQGALISGLHVVSNLQYLSPSENSVKGNNFEPQFIVPNEE